MGGQVRTMGDRECYPARPVRLKPAGRMRRAARIAGRPASEPGRQIVAPPDTSITAPLM